MTLRTISIKCMCTLYINKCYQLTVFQQVTYQHRICRQVISVDPRDSHIGRSLAGWCRCPAGIATGPHYTHPHLAGGDNV